MASIEILPYVQLTEIGECPTCDPPHGDGVWYGPCADGRWHRSTCPVAAESKKKSPPTCGCSNH